MSIKRHFLLPSSVINRKPETDGESVDFLRCKNIFKKAFNKIS